MKKSVSYTFCEMKTIPCLKKSCWTTYCSHSTPNWAFTTVGDVNLLLKSTRSSFLSSTLMLHHQKMGFPLPAVIYLAKNLSGLKIFFVLFLSLIGNYSIFLRSFPFLLSSDLWSGILLFLSFHFFIFFLFISSFSYFSFLLLHFFLWEIRFLHRSCLTNGPFE